MIAISGKQILQMSTGMSTKIDFFLRPIGIYNLWNTRYQEYFQLNTLQSDYLKFPVNPV